LLPHGVVEAQQVVAGQIVAVPKVEARTLPENEPGQLAIDMLARPIEEVLQCTSCTEPSPRDGCQDICGPLPGVVSRVGTISPPRMPINCTAVRHRAAGPPSVGGAQRSFSPHDVPPADEHLGYSLGALRVAVLLLDEPAQPGHQSRRRPQYEAYEPLRS